MFFWLPCGDFTRYYGSVFRYGVATVQTITYTVFMSESQSWHELKFEGGPTAQCRTGETILAAATRAGVAIAVGCRGGGCGVCRIGIMEGRYRTLPMSRAHIGLVERAAGQALACRVLPEGDMKLRCLGRRPWKANGKVSHRWQ